MKINKINVNGTDYDIEAVSGGSVTSVVSKTGDISTSDVADALTGAGHKLTDTNTWVAATTSADGYVPKATKGMFLHSNASTGALEWTEATSNEGTVTSVGMTVPTGFSISGTPITSSGILALSFAEGYSLPTTAKLSNWDTAYGWGDHSQAGYLTQHQSLSSYATKAYVDDIIGVNASVLTTLTDLADAMEDENAATGIITVLAAKANSSDLATVATSGSYTNLSNTPALVTETTVTNWGFTKNTGTYIKPSGGIPKTDMTSTVLASLDLADTALQTLPNNLTYFSADDGTGIVPSDGIRVSTVAAGATITVSPDVITVVNGNVGTAAITLTVPNDNLAHVWDILMTTGSSVSVTIAMSNQATIKVPSYFAINSSKALEVNVIGVGNTYYLRYGEFV